MNSIGSNGNSMIASANGGNTNFGVPSLSLSSGTAAAANTVIQQDRGVAALLVMLAVLCFIFAYCCWGAPFCRRFCRRYCCCCYCCGCGADGTDSESGGFNSVSGVNGSAGVAAAATAGQTGAASSHRHQEMMGTPTIILLPHGRMLVVDSTIFSQLQAENTGLDLVELGESVIRAQRGSGGASRHHHHLHHHQLQNSQASIIEMDAETPSKDSMGSLGCFPPPTYESIYGKEEAGDMPPTYSDVLLHRFANLPYEVELRDYERGSKDEIEMRSLDSCPHIINNPFGALQNYPYGVSGAYASQSLPRNIRPRRNPSLISNPFDSYHVDNELAGLHEGQRRRQQQQQRQCCQNANNATSSAGRRTRRISCHNIYEITDETITRQRRYSNSDGRRACRTNDEELARSAEIVLDNRFNEAWERSSRSQSDALNCRNSGLSISGDSRSDDLDDDVSRTNATYATSRSEDSVLDDEIPAARGASHRESRPLQSTRAEPHDWNLDVRFNSAEGRPDSRGSDRRDGDGEEAAEEDTSNFKTLPDIRESRV